MSSPTDLDEYLSANSAGTMPSTAEYVERGGALVNAAALTKLRKLRPALQKKIGGLERDSILRRHLDLLALYLDECAADRATVTTSVRETAFALLYFLKGFDRIPDSVPEIGLLDDALVVQCVLDRHAAALRTHWLRHRRSWPLEG